MRMKNNYKNLSVKSPSENISVFKRSTSNSIRSSIRITRKNIAPSCDTVNAFAYSSLPSHIPPKAAALLEIPLPTIQVRSTLNLNNDQKLKVASFRKRSVWANSAASKRYRLRGILYFILTIILLL